MVAGFFMFGIFVGFITGFASSCIFYIAKESDNNQDQNLENISKAENNKKS